MSNKVHGTFWVFREEIQEDLERASSVLFLMESNDRNVTGVILLFAFAVSGFV